MTRTPLSGRAVFTLRPAGEEGPLLAALRERGAIAVNVAVIRLQGIAAREAAAAMRAAMSARRVLFTSPAAVRHARRIDGELALGWFAPSGTLAACARNGGVFAPGPGTAAALGHAGIDPVQIPATRFDSEGILALPALAAPVTGAFALVNAPDGRKLLETTLAERGADVFDVPVYRRENHAPDAGSVQQLLQADQPILVASSGSALDRLASLLGETSLAALAASAHVVLPGERLSARAAALGFIHRTVARSAQDHHLAAAAEAAAAQPADRSGKDDSVSMTP